MGPKIEILSFKTFWMQWRKCVRKQTDIWVCMTEDLFFWPGVLLSLLKVREYQGLWHICIKPFFILPLGSIVLLGGESWRSLKNPHFPLAQRWLGWGLSLVFRGKKWRDHNHERIERSFSQSYFQSFTILLLLSSLQFSSSPFLYANGSKVLKRKVQ